MTETTTETRPKISLKDVHKAFGPKVVLDGLDLDIAEGRSTVVIGGSGVGKSVMLKCILGLLTPDSGSVEIDGVSVLGLSSGERDRVNRKIGMLFQGAALFDSLPVWENVAFRLLSDGTGRDEALEIAVRKLAQVGLRANVGHLSPADLSGGMRKRVGLARAIAGDPEIIFFDEPTTGLDPIMSGVINELIVSCVKELGATALSITHDMESAQKIGDRIAMIYNGRIIWNGPADEVAGSDNELVEQFVNGRADGPIQMALRA